LTLSINLLDGFFTASLFEKGPAEQPTPFDSATYRLSVVSENPHSKNPTGDRFVVPTLAKNARMGQPQVVVIHGAEAQGWASARVEF
jgi:hypothetical protein